MKHLHDWALLQYVLLVVSLLMCVQIEWDIVNLYLIVFDMNSDFPNLAQFYRSRFPDI
jgi:hypothetical protein